MKKIICIFGIMALLAVLALAIICSAYSAGFIAALCVAAELSALAGVFLLTLRY